MQGDRKRPKNLEDILALTVFNGGSQPKEEEMVTDTRHQWDPNVLWPREKAGVCKSVTKPMQASFSRNGKYDYIGHT